MDYLNNQKGNDLYNLLNEDNYEYAASLIYEIYRKLFVDKPEPSIGILIGLRISACNVFKPEKHINMLYMLPNGEVKSCNTLFVCSPTERSFFFAAVHFIGEERFAELQDFFENKLIRQLKIHSVTA